MKLSLSNIGWDTEHNERICSLMSDLGYYGLEIAPSAVFGENPYDKMNETQSYAESVKDKYFLNIVSIQSIWYKRPEMLFGSDERDRQFLTEYTKKAIDFAESLGCMRIVFGNPKNRKKGKSFSKKVSNDFFNTIGDYASVKGIKICLEANPVIYGTDFINTTKEAAELCKELNSDGICINLDIGTVIANDESLSTIDEVISLIGHVHVSEPMLKPVIKRSLHCELKSILSANNYNGCISVEMAKTGKIEDIEEAAYYLKEVFG